MTHPEVRSSTTIPVFICYRQSDGKDVAARVYDLLHGQVLDREGQGGGQRKLDVYFDQMAPSAGDWTSIHEPFLKRSRAFVVICSPGAKLREGDDDWVHREIDWWIDNRPSAPILVDTLGQGTRYVPDRIAAKWPNAQRIVLIDKDWERFDPSKLETEKAKTLSRLLGGIVPSAASIYREEMERERERVEQLQKSLDELRALARSLELAEAFRLLGQTSPSSPMARGRFSDVAGRLRRLELDPIMALHHSLAADIQQISPTSIVDVEGEVSYIRVSRDGDLVLVVYDYQNFGGSPDIEDIPEWTACALYRLSTSEWVLKHRLDSSIGNTVYSMNESQVIDLDSPHYLILRRGEGKARKTLLRFSLLDGGKRSCDERTRGEYAKAFKQSKADDVPKELEQYLSPSTLFRVLPEDGIDVEYGPRLVDRVFVTSPDHRTAIVGTYEGRLLLLDLAAARVRGEKNFGPIFAAAYQHDGSRAFFADHDTLFKIDTSGWPGIREVPSALRTEPGKSMGEGLVLATTLSDDASLLAMATKHHLLGLIVRENRWIVWELPREIEKAAALRIDHERHVIDLVVGDDGTLISGDYREYPSRLNVSPSPTGGHATVAWLDADQPGAWLSETSIVEGSARIRFVPMPGRGITPLEMSVRLRGSYGTYGSPPEEAELTIHAMAKIENHLVLFYGDADFSADRAMWDERMIILPIGGREAQSDHVVFHAEGQVDNLGEMHWTSEHVEGLLIGSQKERMLALARGLGSMRIVAVKPDGVTEPTGESLASRDYVDRDQVYSFGVNASATGPWLTVSHLKLETTLRHQLPWAFKAPPEFATIGGGGRHIAVVSSEGDVLIVDLSIYELNKQTNN